MVRFVIIPYVFWTTVVVNQQIMTTTAATFSLLSLAIIQQELYQLYSCLTPYLNTDIFSLSLWSCQS